MAGNGSPDGQADPAAGYDIQDLPTRMRHGLKVDRRANNAWSCISDLLWKMKETGDASLIPNPAMRYDISRNRLWQTRRLANARLVGKTRIHKRIMTGWHAIMLDLLADRQPTIKDWSMLAEGDRQTRRVREYHPHLVRSMDGMTYELTHGPDGVTKTPLKTVREGTKDGRCQQITTSYSSPAILRDDFDLRTFADCSYMVRQGQFWEDALKGLSRWMESGNAIRRDGEWLVRHMVNNDIAMHVIFDNISREVEMRWFEGLGDGAKYEIAGRLNTEWEMVRYSKEELGACLNEMRDSFMVATEPPPGMRHAWQRGDKEISVDFDAIREMHEADLQIISMICEADGGLPHARRTLEYVMQPLAAEDAVKAVNKMAEFAAGFERRVPENLQKYMIEPDKMDYRARDIMLETIAMLGLSDSADERSAADAMIQGFHGRFGRHQYSKCCR